jgi:hypothetical protein
MYVLISAFYGKDGCECDASLDVASDNEEVLHRDLNIMHEKE